MRNMSFSITTRHMKDRKKTVTRRFGWWFLKPGDIVMACEKCMGLKKGEKVKKLYPIRIKTTKAELPGKITREECIKEGFPDMTPKQFTKMLLKYNKKKHYDFVNRIEFVEVKPDL